MGRPNIPRRDSDAAAWMRNFSMQLDARFADYFVTETEAIEVAELVANFRSKLAVTLVRQIRSAVSVAAKNDARTAAEAVIRPIYMRVKSDSRVSEPLKMSLGIRPTPAVRTRSAAPRTAPALIIESKNQTYTVDWYDPTKRGRGKPAGCAMLQLYLAVADGEKGRSLHGADGDVVAEAGRPVNVYTSNRVRLHQRDLIPPDEATRDRVKTAAFVARWASPTGQPGPWSRPKAIRLAA